MHDNGRHTMTVTTIDWQAARAAETVQRQAADDSIAAYERGLLTVAELADALLLIVMTDEGMFQTDVPQ